MSLSVQVAAPDRQWSRRQLESRRPHPKDPAAAQPSQPSPPLLSASHGAWHPRLRLATNTPPGRSLLDSNRGFRTGRDEGDGRLRLGANLELPSGDMAPEVAHTVDDAGAHTSGGGSAQRRAETPMAEVLLQRADPPGAAALQSSVAGGAGERAGAAQDDVGWDRGPAGSLAPRLRSMHSPTQPDSDPAKPSDSDSLGFAASGGGPAAGAGVVEPAWTAFPGGEVWASIRLQLRAAAVEEEEGGLPPRPAAMVEAAVCPNGGGTPGHLWGADATQHEAAPLAAGVGKRRRSGAARSGLGLVCAAHSGRLLSHRMPRVNARTQSADDWMRLR
jgi:hypothetical protein